MSVDKELPSEKVALPNEFGLFVSLEFVVVLADTSERVALPDGFGCAVVELAVVACVFVDPNEKVVLPNGLVKVDFSPFVVLLVDPSAKDELPREPTWNFVSFLSVIFCVHLQGLHWHSKFEYFKK